ncbi:MAG: hypothetical protein ACFFAN_15245 [Promethearchaeota archaeon]
MMDTKHSIKATKQAVKNFENIKEAIKGLYEILNINLKDKDIYLSIGKDNLMGLYSNLIQLLSNNYGLRQLIKKINNSELDLDIVLNELLVNK